MAFPRKDYATLEEATEYETDHLTVLVASEGDCDRCPVQGELICGYGSESVEGNGARTNYSMSAWSVSSDSAAES
jgi:hypothetical protein